ncbi:TIR domain-containing protein [Sphingopyxis sp.]|uniref:TIR domain-containing protein n=1 Tax=Sphingopyxis sp. TaxID=1908224 RepID=UPI003D0D31D8
MEEAKRPTLFVSHHSSKYEVALHVEKALARHGVDCWIAPRDVGPGDAFDTAIMKAIRDSAGVLLLFCSQSDKSPHVKRELILADSAHKAIIPLRLEEIVPDDLAYHLASAQWIDWLEKRDDSIARIAAKAHQLAGLTPAATTAAVAIAPDATAAADNLHAAILTQASGPATPAPGGGMVKTLVIGALLIAVAVLGAMLFMRGGDEKAALAEAPTQTAVSANPDAATTPAVASEAPTSSMTPATATPLPAAAASTETAPPVAEGAPAAPPRAKIPPTFNCDKAGTHAEKLICSSDELASLDREMARAYRQLSGVAVKRRELLQTEQSRWRLSVRDGCPDEACMSRVMRQRIMILDERRTETLQNRAAGAAAE